MAEPLVSEHPGARSQVTLKTAFTVCFAAAATVGATYFLVRTQVALLLSLGGCLLAVALDHAVEGLVKRVGWKRGWALAFVVGAMLAFLAGFFVLLVPTAVAQARALIEEVPEILGRLRRSGVFSFVERRFGVAQKVQEAVEGSAVTRQLPLASTLSAVGSVLSWAAGLVSFLFISIFMLIFGRERVQAFLVHTHPSRRHHYERVLSQTYSAIGGYMGGVLLICAINATLTTTFLGLVPRLPFFVALGILSGTSSLVPYAGPIVTGALISGVALATMGWWPALATASYFVLYGQLEGNVLAPLIFRRTVHLNPLVTLLAILFLAEWMGVVGAVLAVPVVAAAQIILGELLSLRRENWLLTGVPESRDTHL